MTTKIDKDLPEQLVFCSFCPNTNTQVYIFCGERGNICEECVDTIIEIRKMKEKGVSKFLGKLPTG